MAKILVISSQEGFRNSLSDRLSYEGHAVFAVCDLNSPDQMYAHCPYNVVICEDRFFFDLKTIKERSEFCPNAAIMVMAESNMTGTVVDAMRKGAFDYFTKPVDFNRLRESIDRIMADPVQAAHTVAPPRQPAAAVPAVVQRPQAVSATPALDRQSFVEDIIGASGPVIILKGMIDKVAPSEAKVLITGENGTGKELVAKWIHEKSPRRDKPFIEVNCAAIPAELIESELFGHEKGSFTTALKSHKGKFEQANGGTLFLDEIGDMSLSAQAKVLYALQNNRIQRVGSEEEITVNVRVMAATNKNLYEQMEKGLFREDLFHRLSVIVIEVPTLDERKDDIPLLVDHFITKICQEYSVAKKGIEPAAVERLVQMSWGGNIRQLRNVVERLIILCGNIITLADVKTYVEHTSLRWTCFKENVVTGI